MNAEYYLINSNISWKLLKDSVVAVNLDDGNYYTFNYIASVIWQYVNQNKSVNDIEQLIREEFSDTEMQTVKDDIKDILRFWETEGLVRLKKSF